MSMRWTCRIGLHKWDGCRCKACGRQRDREHSWDACRCSVCGRHRDEHKWERYRCQVCGETRPAVEYTRPVASLVSASYLVTNPRCSCGSWKCHPGGNRLGMSMRRTEYDVGRLKRRAA